MGPIWRLGDLLSSALYAPTYDTKGYIRIHKDFRQQVRNLFASPVLKDRINKTYVFTAYIAGRT